MRLLAPAFDVPFQGRTTYHETFCFVEPCFGLWFDGCLDFSAMISPVVHIGAIAVSFLFVVMMFNIQIAEIHEEVLRYLPTRTATRSSDSYKEVGSMRAAPNPVGQLRPPNGEEPDVPLAADNALGNYYDQAKSK
ncbi:hypothetical protein ZIOFF_074281 (mitochondrion) [Zingiber officinale]|uniref:Uncharacterized protein n=1 Tax=Zingiber officinale TaxID=94328 RepID=A0A8J5E9E5_ZINOF|nr:hypothetical protein ZIOFF_074281 [Zingiber officinale]